MKRRLIFLHIFRFRNHVTFNSISIYLFDICITHSSTFSLTISNIQTEYEQLSVSGKVYRWNPTRAVAVSSAFTW